MPRKKNRNQIRQNATRAKQRRKKKMSLRKKDRDFYLLQQRKEKIATKTSTSEGHGEMLIGTESLATLAAIEKAVEMKKNDPS